MVPTATSGNCSQSVFSQRATTFHLASRLFPSATRRKVVELYGFLRTVDDIVDDATDPIEAGVRFQAYCDYMSSSAAPGEIVVPGLSFPLDRQAVLDFMAGQRSDLERSVIQTEEELLQYCYQVAGTVGLMMCPILGAHGGAARLAAMHLGMAMQLTNIARDVLEDGRRGRVYLPLIWMRQPVLPRDIGLAENSEAVQEAVVRLLQLAEQYYDSAIAGFPHLPRRNRLVILIAARLYRQIGRKILADPSQALKGRARLGVLEKSAQCLIAFCQWLPCVAPSVRESLSVPPASPARISP